MALVETQEVALRISAETSGQSDVSALVSRIEDLAREGGEAAPQLAAIADEVRKLGAQKVQIEGLSGAIDAAKRARAALVEARSEVQTLDKALADAKGAGANAQAVKLLEKELAGANRQLAAAERAWGIQTAALRESRAEAAAAGVDVRNLGEAQRAVAAGFEAASSSIDAQAASMNRARQAEQERAALVRQQAAEEDRLAAIVAASKAKLAQAAQDQLAAEKRAYAEAEAAAKRYADQTRAIAAAVQGAFGTIGIRSSKTIQAEILQINQGLQRLAADAKTTGADFDRAFAAAQKRIAALQAEMSGSVDPFTAAVGRAGSGVDGLVTKLKPLGLALAAAFSVDQIGRTAVAFDSLNRTLTAIKGSGDAAAAELGYIISTANRLGLELGSASKAYSSFLAVTRGTALEGQQARDVFEAVAGAMARLGKSAADTDGAMLALSQMVSKGVVSMEELRQQLAERLPGAMKAAADGVGLTEAELIKMVETGQVLAEDLLPALAGQLNKLYGSAGEVEGYAAGWNRLTSAVMSSIGVFTQTDAVMTAVSGSMAVLRETVLVVGTGFVVAAEGVTFFGKALGTVAGAVTTWSWSGLKAELSKLADESIDRINQVARQTAIAKGVQDGLTGSVSDTGEAASKAAAGWLAITNAYAQVNAAADAYVKQSEKALQARQAESAAIAQYVQAVGTVQQQHEAEASSAQAVADATQQLADAKAAQLGALQSQLAAQEQVVAANENESVSKRKLIEETRRKIELAQQESAQAAAAAQQAQMEAASRQAAAAAVADNAAQLEALRAAYEQAGLAVKRLEEDERAGIATAEEVAAARAKAVFAAGLYRDAVNDTVRGIELQSKAQQAAVTVEERQVQLKLAAVRTAEAAAKASGNEVAAAWRAVEVKRQEARLAELKAKAQRLEASATLEKLNAQERELKATGQLDAAKLKELEAAKALATAKQIEGEISAELARQLHAEADAAIRAMNARKGLAEGSEALGSASESAAEGVESLTAAAGGSAAVAKVLGDIWTSAVDAIGKISPAAKAAVESVNANAASFHQYSSAIRGLRRDAQQLVSDDPLADARESIAALTGEMEKLQVGIDALDINSRFGAGLGFAGFWDGVRAMRELEYSLKQAQLRQAELTLEVGEFNQAVSEGSLTLAQQERALAGLVARADELGSNELSGLRSALDSVRQQMQAIDDAARSTLDSIADELDQINGRYEEIERRRAAQRRADIESQLDQARASGEGTAVADLQRALQGLAEIERLKIAEARERQKAEQARKQADQAPKSTTVQAVPSRSAESSDVQRAAPATQVHRVELSFAGRSASINTDARGAQQLTSFLSELESYAGRVN